jgi:hypothetical protein
METIDAIVDEGIRCACAEDVVDGEGGTTHTGKTTRAIARTPGASLVRGEIAAQGMLLTGSSLPGQSKEPPT